MTKHTKTRLKALKSNAYGISSRKHKGWLLDAVKIAEKAEAKLDVVYSGLELRNTDDITVDALDLVVQVVALAAKKYDPTKLKLGATKAKLEKIGNYANNQADMAQIRLLKQTKLYDDTYWQPVLDKIRFELLLEQNNG